MLLPLVLLLVTSLPLASGQDDLNIRSADTIYEEVCEKLEEVKYDFRRYMWVYKQFATMFIENSPGTNECRDELNRMFELIKCIQELAREMDKLKNLIRRGAAGRDSFRKYLQDWLILVQDKQAELFELADILRNKDFTPSDPKVFLNATQTFDELNIGCIDRIQGGLIGILENEVLFALQQANLVVDPAFNRPVLDICDKARKMKDLCKEMMMRFQIIRKHLPNKFMLTGPLFPHREMADLCRCIIQFCRCIDDLIDVCRNANNMTPAQIEKRVCEILMKIKEIRNSIVGYWDALFKKSLKLAKLVDKVTEVRRYFKKNPFKKLILAMDDCIFKLECIYIDIVTGVVKISRPTIQ